MIERKGPRSSPWSWMWSRDKARGLSP